MNQNRFKGFTLIELLVVIAIIGILSAVVLASLNTARSKGNDAAIKSNLDTIRSQSAIYYDTNNAYSNGAVTASATGVQGTSCTGITGVANSLFADPNISAAMSGADKAAGGTGTGYTNVTKLYCAISASPVTTWLISSPLVATAGTFWCVDSTGASKQEAAAPAANANACL